MQIISSFDSAMYDVKYQAYFGNNRWYIGLSKYMYGGTHRVDIDQLQYNGLVVKII